MSWKELYEWCVKVKQKSAIGLIITQYMGMPLQDRVIARTWDGIVRGRRILLTHEQWEFVNRASGNRIGFVLCVGEEWDREKAKKCIEKI